LRDLQPILLYSGKVQVSILIGPDIRTESHIRDGKGLNQVLGQVVQLHLEIREGILLLPIVWSGLESDNVLVITFFGSLVSNMTVPSTFD
jgi:hypothetical protein